MNGDVIAVDLSSLLALFLGFMVILVLLRYIGSAQNYKSLNNKVVLITGASSGLGKACCFAFQKQGFKVILCSRNLVELKKVQEELQAVDKTSSPEVFTVDLSDTGSVEFAVKKILDTCGGKIDILVNNAGLRFRGNILSTAVQVYESMFAVNFFGQVAITNALLPSFIDNKCGHVVGIGSVQAKLATPFRAPYAASKHACQAYYDSLRAEVEHLGISVTVINPGYIQTNSEQNALSSNGMVIGRNSVSATDNHGMKPEFVAERIVNAVARGKKEVMIAPLHHKAALWIRLICPSLYFWIITKRSS